MDTYVSLHNHTTSSNERLIDSINRPQKLIKTAHELGLAGLAITDHESVGAHVKCSKYYKDHKDELGDFKLIFGNEIYLCRNGLNAANYDPSKGDAFFHFILLAKDEEGHHQLRQLSTQAYEHSFMRSKIRRVPTYYSELESIIDKNPGHLIGSTACIGGYLGKHLLSAMHGNVELEKETEKLYNWIKYIHSIFGENNFYLELQPSFNAEQIYVNKWLVEAGQQLNIPTIITTDTHYYDASYRPVHKAFLSSKDGDREVDDFYATTYLMGLDEIHNFMDESVGAEIVNKSAENTLKIAEQCEIYSLERPFKLPYLPSEEDKKLALKNTYPWPRGVKLNREIWNYFTQSSEPSDHVFVQRLLKKCNTDPSRFWSEQSLAEIELELQTVRDASIKQKMVWSRYFLQVADYIDIMWNEGDSIVAPGRGSGVGFYINYLLDITQVDPLREEVPTRYWRFLNPERASILD